ncbi:MAG: SpvB/TcaC N-terminal domain-containing protein [Kofleriaceae bacterium]
MGEKFSANPVTGTGSMTIPIATSPGRSGFGPQLTLTYDSGSGNGPFGLGWSLSIPSIQRKTDKGMPEYRDAAETDVYVLSGAEDLVPVLEDGGRHVDHTVDSDYVVHRYRPRVEGLFARIERWTRHDTGDIHWRSISRDNITNIYGPDRQSRIFDPADVDWDHPARVFTWLLRQSHDDKGNVIHYEYVGEDDAGVDSRQSNERNRTRTAGRYLKRVLYGNRTSRLAQPSWETDGWLFEVVFDYDEDHVRDLAWDPMVSSVEQHHRTQASGRPARRWAMRPDPFSAYRPGFEVRSYRRCHRVLMFHYFDELTARIGGEPYLVRATELHYDDLGYDAPIDVDAELAHAGSTRVASFIRSVNQVAFVHDPDAAVEDRDGVRFVTYLRKSLPPVQFEYSKARISEELDELEAVDLENLPAGLAGRGLHWIDLDGEGLSGILTEQADGWFYKSNLGDGHFGPLRVLPTRPNVQLASGGQQLVDLTGDGRLDVVAFAGPTPGFYERTPDDDWEPFRAFEQVPAVRWDDPNLRLVDLDGDGHADVLITENEVVTWHRSRGERGFESAARVPQPEDEEHGPRLVLADGTQSIYLADLSGDGLTDLVRIRNGEVCYWPNLGYGRFGGKVTMDDAPWFDSLDHFDHRRIRLVDIDGSGTSDLIYLHRDGVRLYFNQSGNRWSAARSLRHLPPVDNLTSVTTADLLGNGTACLVWSSPLPHEVRSPIRYVDLMGGQKPHLLIRTANNLGLETEVSYAPSTRYYLADKRAGTPWVTRIPFPVHCVDSVTVTDRWRGTRFSTSFSYHHGYFDGEEREFRGFGRIEQLDAEHYGAFTAGNSASPYITDDHQLYQPPIKTITWFHTGAMLDRHRILSQYADEYFPRSFEDQDREARNVLGSFRERELPEPDLALENLTADEWREALRACKGMALRTEIYELDVDALAAGQPRPVKIFSAAHHSCHVRRLQSRGENRHAVFLVTESEAITYHYELDLRGADVEPDPRITHSLNLNVDAHGNVLQAIAVVYPRIGRHRDSSLPPGTEERIVAVQRELHLAYSEHRYTNDIDGPDIYRLRVPYQETTFELTGVTPAAGDGYFTREELRALQLSRLHQPADAALAEVIELPYHHLPAVPGPHKRLVEEVRTLFLDADLETPLALGTLGHLGLPYESYKLALTDDLLAAVFSEEQLAAARTDLNTPSVSGYASGAVVGAAGHWIRSGIVGFQADAATHFYAPERYTDAFGNTTIVSLDPRYELFVESSRDPVGNVTRVRAFDHRVLAPTVIQDLNDNLIETAYDILGLPAAIAVRGKGDGREGDDLGPFHADVMLTQPPVARVARVFMGSYSEPDLRRLLTTATTRQLYWFGELVDPTTGAITYGTSPSGGCSVLREIHVADQAPGSFSTIQVVFEYSDGGGNLLASKAKAEPEHGSTALRWLTSGKTVLNNKGKPVKQYEPYFSSNEQRFEELREVGVTPVVYYDAAGRAVRTEQPDGTYARVDFSPWHVTSHDAADTVLESGNAWYAARRALPLTDPERRAADQSAAHAETPATVMLDSRGREVISIVHNRFEDRLGVRHDEKYVTFTRLDAEGKPLWLRDARGNLVMQYITPVKPTRADDELEPSRADDVPTTGVPAYDIAGNLLFQHSMDAGDRWMLPNAGGQPMYRWETNVRITDEGGRVTERRIYQSIYDALHRPVEQWLRIGDEQWMIERLIYGEAVSPADARARNLRGQLHQFYDASGLVTNHRFGATGHLEETSRQLTAAVQAPVIDWSEGFFDVQLEAETFHRFAEHDALGRMTRLFNWHRDPGRVMVYEPRYGERGLLSSEDVFVSAARDATGRRAGGNRIAAVSDLRYNAKGQREHVIFGNGTITQHHYDPVTSRLTQIRTTRPGYRPRFPEHRSGLRDDQVLQQLYYSHDVAGNITQIHDDAYEPVFFRNQRVLPESRYAYDAIYRLIHATGRESASSDHAPAAGPVTPAPPASFPITDQTLRPYDQYYGYDSAGNIEEMSHVARGGGWTRSYDYAPDSNRLLSTHTRNAVTSTVRYEYDLHGSMLDLGSSPDEFHVRWDYRDMIRSINLGGGGTAHYNYDGSKQRTRKTIRHQRGHVQWERLYIDGMELYRGYSSSGTVIEEIETHHIFVEDERILIIDETLAARDVGTDALYRYQYGNHVGSIGVELDASGEIVSYEEYHPFGTSALQARGHGIRASHKRYRFTGMERDEETGLNYHAARYYAPWLGRWTSADPMGIGAGMNFKAYANNSPLSFVDPEGTQPVRISRRVRPVYLPPMEPSALEEAQLNSMPSEHLPRDQDPILDLTDPREHADFDSYFNFNAHQQTRQTLMERWAGHNPNAFGERRIYSISRETGRAELRDIEVTGDRSRAAIRNRPGQFFIRRDGGHLAITNRLTIRRINDPDSVGAQGDRLLNFARRTLREDLRRYDGQFPATYYREFGRALITESLRQHATVDLAVSRLDQLFGQLVEDTTDKSVYHMYEALVGGWDSVQHFVHSAALTHNWGNAVTDVLQVAKEVWGAVSGDPEGYSDRDMTANNEGQALGGVLEHRWIYDGAQ